MAEGKRYFWLKLKEDFFSSKRIKKLRKLAGGDTYTIIYLKMQLLSLKHDGEIQYTGLENTFAEELALDLDESVENVQVTLQYLQSCGLIETSDNINFLLPYAIENTGSEGSSAQRMRELRARQASHCDTSVTQPLQIGDGEKEKIKSQSQIQSKSQIVSNPNGFDCGSADAEQRVADAWNKLSLKPISKIIPGKQRDVMLKARLREYGIDKVLEAIEIIPQCPFLMGDNRKGWTITFDWFVRPNNFPKVLEGNYLKSDSEASNPFVRIGDDW